MKKLILVLLAMLLSLLIQTPSNAMIVPIKTTFGQNTVQVASEYIGHKYCRGGKSPKCFDCSGFTQYIYAQMGVSLPRTGGEQLKMMVRVLPENAKPGDIVFFSTKSGYIYHVGIYIGDGMMIHSPKPGQRVKIAPVFKNPIYATLPIT